MHSPCGGASSPDPRYPYAGGGIGVQGYDLVNKQFVSASMGKDVMGYCEPEWISDYTYQALLERMQAVNMVADVHGLRARERFRFLNVAPGAAPSWGSEISLRHHPAGEERTVTFYGADGSIVGTGVAHYFRYDHLAGGYLLVPEGPAGAVRVAIPQMIQIPR
jgi:hypothetical protein